MTQSVENINRNNMKAMNLMRLVVPTLLFAVGDVASAQNTTPKYDENALTIPKTIEVIDTAKAVATANSIKTSAKARCNSLRNELEIIEGAESTSKCNTRQNYNKSLKNSSLGGVELFPAV